MTRYREALPQLEPVVFLTDSGIETDLIFNKGIDLPEFAAFPLLDDGEGLELLVAYYRSHAAVAVDARVGFVLESATWRANADWGARLGYDAIKLDRVNKRAIALLVEIREEFAAAAGPFPVSGCLGPRADAYRPEALMTVDDASRYHRAQIESLADTEADQITAMTLTYADEAAGITLAAREAGLPVVLSFTVETDGRLPDGTSLAAAIVSVDDATDGYPAYYMVNCAHPSHFAAVLEPGSSWTARIRGVRANASSLSHAELDEATNLDSGDPVAFGLDYAHLRTRVPDITVLGGCCGTDLRHIEQVSIACL
jgi:S-methylmethionine-dependent homocysteine/selenocysteine methylase